MKPRGRAVALALPKEECSEDPLLTAPAGPTQGDRWPKPARAPHTGAEMTKDLGDEVSYFLCPYFETRSIAIAMRPRYGHLGCPRLVLQRGCQTGRGRLHNV